MSSTNWFNTLNKKKATGLLELIEKKSQITSTSPDLFDTNQIAKIKNICSVFFLYSDMLYLDENLNNTTDFNSEPMVSNKMEKLIEEEVDNLFDKLTLENEISQNVIDYKATLTQDILKKIKFNLQDASKESTNVSQTKSFSTLKNKLYQIEQNISDFQFDKDINFDFFLTVCLKQILEVFYMYLSDTSNLTKTKTQILSRQQKYNTYQNMKSAFLNINEKGKEESTSNNLKDKLSAYVIASMHEKKIL